MSRCKCPNPVEHLHRVRGGHGRASCLTCGKFIALRAMSFDFDRIDWDEEKFPEGGPYAGKTFKEIAETDPAFVKWYAENVPSRPQRDLANRLIGAFHL